MSGHENRLYASVFGPFNNSVENEFEQLPDGSFRVRFRPLEAGCYKIKIFKGTGNELLSEFVHDISEENVGDYANFTINVEQHERSYSATVTSPSNVTVECTVEQSGENCSVRFLPTELGDHIIRIFQDGSGVPVSEFVYAVTDLNREVGTASINEGFRIGEKAKLIIDPNTGTARRYRATIISPSNIQIDCDFEELDDERCKVRFVPNEAGDHTIKIFKLGTNKVVYEFTFLAEDKNVGQITTFTITIQEYKPKLTAIITSPSNAQVECEIEETSDENWVIKFVPREIGDHVVKLFQDDTNEPITQFVYRVVERKSTVQPGRNVFRVGEPIRLTFNCDGRMVVAETEFSATVTSPSGKAVKCIFEELDDGTCKIRFIPTELGTYTVKLFKVGRDSPISEFTFDAKEEHQDETASFTITIQARKLNFSAIVTSPSNKEVDCVVEEASDGHCLVRFTPSEIGNYTIRIFENNDSLPVATIIYKIVDHRYDLSRKLPSENIFRVGELIRLTVNIAEEKRKFSATVTSPSNALIDCAVEESEEGNCIVKFTPREPGDYVIRIFQGSNPIPVSQFTYTVKSTPGTPSTPTSPTTSRDTYIVGEPANFTINVNEASTRKYSATVTSPSGENLHCRVEETDDGSCRVRFIPTEIGDYAVRLFQNDMQICQFTYKVNDLSKREPANAVSYGSNFKDSIDGKYVYIQDQVFKLGEKVSFYLNLEEQSKFVASVTSPRHALLACDVEERRPDEFVIRFVPKELGDHVIKIYNDNTSVPVYQFIYKVRGFLHRPVEFKVTSFSPEPGRLAYKIMCPPKSTINYEKNEDGGLYEINVHLNAANEKSAPTHGSGADKCTAEGVGLRKAKVGEMASFEVNTRNAGRGSLMVGVEGPKQPAKEIIVKHIGHQVFSVKYVLDMVGNYSLYVLWGGEHIPGSPFHVTV